MGCATPSDYSPYIDNSYNLRTSVVSQAGPLKTLNVESSGTAFVLKKGIKSYFITSSHVVVPPNKTLSDEAKAVMRNIIYSIGEDRQDNNVLDDYNMRLVAVDKDKDLAVLEFMADVDGDVSSSVRWIAKPPKHYGKPDIGNQAFSVGYKMSMKKTLEPGIVNSEPFKCELGNAVWTSIDGLPGMSGAPVYEIDDGVVELIGVATKISPSGTDTLAVDIHGALDLLDRFLKHPRTEQRNLEEVMGDYYDYIIH